MTLGLQDKDVVAHDTPFLCTEQLCKLFENPGKHERITVRTRLCIYNAGFGYLNFYCGLEIKKKVNKKSLSEWDMGVARVMSSSCARLYMNLPCLTNMTDSAILIKHLLKIAQLRKSV